MNRRGFLAGMIGAPVVKEVVEASDKSVLYFCESKVYTPSDSLPTSVDFSKMFSVAIDNNRQAMLDAINYGKITSE